MPSRSAKQAKLMRAVAHGWKPDRMKGPTKAVAKEFVEADERRGKVAGYQYGGMAGIGPAYRGARNMMPGGGGGGRGGALRQMMQRMQSQGGGAPRPGQPMHPGARGPGGGFLSRFAQQTPGQPLHPGAQGPGGGIFARMMQQRGQRPGGGPEQLDMQLPPFNRTPSGEIDLGGGRTPEWGPGMPGRVGGQYDPGGSRSLPPGGIPNDFPGGGIMGEGPGGRLEQESLRRRAKMQGPGRFPGAGGMPGRVMNQAQNRFGALTQGAPGGGGMFGGKQMPGRRIAPPPGPRMGPGRRGNPMVNTARGLPQRYGRRGAIR